jgi:N-acetylglucosaminyldiphosphoundecaprenol N-acetyl-beta-D-mannosaminyltransferase
LAGCKVLVDQIGATKPHIVLVALGAPKQEFWIDKVRESLSPAVFVAVGASLDFVAGVAARAPAWMSRYGLEWLYRFGQEPGRLGRRYFLRDPRFAYIVGRELLARRQRPTTGAL